MAGVVRRQRDREALDSTTGWGRCRSIVDGARADGRYEASSLLAGYLCRGRGRAPIVSVSCDIPISPYAKSGWHGCSTCGHVPMYVTYSSLSRRTLAFFSFPFYNVRPEAKGTGNLRCSNARLLVDLLVAIGPKLLPFEPGYTFRSGTSSQLLQLRACTIAWAQAVEKMMARAQQRHLSDSLSHRSTRLFQTLSVLVG